MNDGAIAPDIRHALEAQYFLFGLGERQCERLFATAVTQSLSPSQILFDQGDGADAFFVVTSGRLKLYRLSLEGDEKIMGLAGAGDSFGESILFMPKPRYPFSVQAIEHSGVVAINRTEYLQALRYSFDTCLAIMGKLTTRIERLFDEVESLTLRDSRYRVVKHLLELLPAPASGPARLRLPAPKSVIAAQLAIRAETFSRTLRMLAQEGTIVLRGGRTIDVPDPGLLRRELGAKSRVAS